jgi:hypothetical protein
MPESENVDAPFEAVKKITVSERDVRSTVNAIQEHGKKLGMSENQLDIEVVSKQAKINEALSKGWIKKEKFETHQKTAIAAYEIPGDYISMQDMVDARLVCFDRRDSTQGDHLVRIFDKVRQTELKDFFCMIGVHSHD